MAARAVPAAAVRPADCPRGVRGLGGLIGSRIALPLAVRSAAAKSASVPERSSPAIWVSSCEALARSSAPPVAIVTGASRSARTQPQSFSTSSMTPGMLRVSLRATYTRERE